MQIVRRRWLTGVFYPKCLVSSVASVSIVVDRDAAVIHWWKHSGCAPITAIIGSEIALAESDSCCMLRFSLFQKQDRTDSIDLYQERIQVNWPDSLQIYVTSNLEETPILDRYGKSRYDPISSIRCRNADCFIRCLPSSRLFHHFCIKTVFLTPRHCSLHICQSSTGNGGSSRVKFTDW